MSDRIAKQVITIGGIGTILVVLLVVFILLGNVLPLFRANTLQPLASIDVALSKSTDDQASKPIACGVDEYGELLWVLHQGDVLTIYSIATGQEIGRHQPNDPGSSGDTASNSKSVTCAYVADNDASLIAGYSDGSVRPITLALQVEFIKPADLSPELTKSLESGFTLSDGSLYRSLHSGLIRKQSVADVTFHPAIAVFEKPVQCVDWRNPQAASSFDESQTWSWGASDGETIALGVIENQVNSFSGAVTQETKLWKSSTDPKNTNIIGLMIGARTNQILSLDAKGHVATWQPSDDEHLALRYSHTSLAGSESKALATIPLLGRSTLMIGSESGHLEGVAMTTTESGQELKSIHQFAGEHGSVVDMAASPEGRLIASHFQSGTNSIYYVPTNRELLTWKDENSNASSQIFFSANAGCVGVLDSNQIKLWRADIPFPEASLSSFFSRIWYEGYEAPQHVWQSSTGNVEGEYKFGFMPLIFGTLKATFYSMLIGAPIALMAAIFGSEFMNSRWRARVKPFIELMASVPSVVLGFVGALVLAPILRDNLMVVLWSVITILFLILFAAHLWLVIPGALAIRLRRFRLLILFAIVPFGIVLSYWTAGWVEQVLFGGDLIQWLSNYDGSGWSGWFCLSLLPMALVVAWAMSGPLNPYFQTFARSMSPFRFSLVNVGIFLGACLVVLILSALAASLVGGIGWDPRGTVLGPYQERNALLVGAILGFAIIPLIYTISEDALQSVPQHLRSASLGCGATTWQTTIRVVVPTAMSGLFSALMIGFGRAVGETMVVLMAAGNTPVMDINPMNGYRTLSATLATELPEAARGSTHYHALFLAAFLLFCFTLVANTVAEMVRLRFRKRAYQL